MPVNVFSNTITSEDNQKAVERAVLAGLGERPPSERWTVHLQESQETSDYFVILEGPEGFEWKGRFRGQHERTPEFIQKAVFHATH